MTTNFSYSTRYILDKAYFNECFEQSVSKDYSWRAYAKAMFFCGFGALLVLLTEVNPYAAWFVFALGIIEALSVYYQHPWWVLRQMLGKASNSEVTLTIDEQGMHSHSYYGDLHILWRDIRQITATELGWVVSHANGKNYISNVILSEGASDYLRARAQALVEAQ